MVQVLITGISGFIAKHLARMLTKAGAEVVGIGRREPDIAVRYVACDVADAEQVTAVMQSVKPHTVYHLAASSVLQAGAEGGAADMLRTNVTGTLNVLEACRAADVAVCVVASSDKQYGALAAPPYDDADFTAFLNGGVYELSKAQGDQTARLWAGIYDVPAVRVARLVNVYGPGDVHFSRIVPGTIRRCVQGEPARITAGRAGEALREYMYVDDAVDALMLLAKDAAQAGNAFYHTPEGRLAHIAFNIAGATRLPAAGVIEAIRTGLRDDFKIASPDPIVQPGPTGVFEPGSQFGKTDKITRLYATHGKIYAPHPLTEGLRQTIPWYWEYLQSGAYGKEKGSEYHKQRNHFD